MQGGGQAADGMDGKRPGVHGGGTSKVPICVTWYCELSGYAGGTMGRGRDPDGRDENMAGAAGGAASGLLEDVGAVQPDVPVDDVVLLHAGAGAVADEDEAAAGSVRGALPARRHCHSHCHSLSQCSARCCGHAGVGAIH